MNKKITFDLTNANDAIEAFELMLCLKRYDVPYVIRKYIEGTIEIEIGTGF